MRDFAALEGPKILVHGGGKIATEMSAAMGIETEMIAGRRVTDSETLRVVTMVYNGVNKQIVSELQNLKCDAIGLCGADGKLMISQKRPPVHVGERLVDYGFVGDPVGVNVELINKLIDIGLTLVVAPITMDENGGLLNTNADTVASSLAVALAVCRDSGVKQLLKNKGRDGVELVYCFENQGVMMDMNDPSSVIPTIDRAKFEELKTQGIVDRGMIPKVENALRAAEKGVSSVVICAAENLSQPRYGGTEIYSSPRNRYS